MSSITIESNKADVFNFVEDEQYSISSKVHSSLRSTITIGNHVTNHDDQRSHEN